MKRKLFFLLFILLFQESFVYSWITLVPVSPLSQSLYYGPRDVTIFSVSNDSRYVAVGFNAICIYINNPEGGTYERCDGSASIYFLKDGELLWEKENIGDFIVSLSLSSNYVTVAVQKAQKIGVGFIYLFDWKGNLIWKKETEWPRRIIITSKNNIILGTQDDYVYAFDKEGNLLWKKKAGGILDISVDGNYIVAGSPNTKTISLLDRNGTVLWRLKVGLLGNVAVSEKGEYVATIVFGNYNDYYNSKNGKVLIFNKDGKLLHEYKNVSTFSLSKEGKYLALAFRDKVVLLDIEGKAMWERGIKHGVLISLNDDFIATGTTNGKLYILTTKGKILDEHWLGVKIKELKIEKDRIIASSGRRLYIFRVLHLSCLFGPFSEPLQVPNAEVVRGNVTYIISTEGIMLLNNEGFLKAIQLQIPPTKVYADANWRYLALAWNKTICVFNSDLNPIYECKSFKSKITGIRLCGSYLIVRFNERIVKFKISQKRGRFIWI